MVFRRKEVLGASASLESLCVAVCCSVCIYIYILRVSLDSQTKVLA